VLFMYITAFLFLGYPNESGFGLENMDPILLAVNRRWAVVLPRARQTCARTLVSFLPSMRQ